MIPIACSRSLTIPFRCSRTAQAAVRTSTEDQKGKRMQAVMKTAIAPEDETIAIATGKARKSDRIDTSSAIHSVRRRTLP